MARLEARLLELEKKKSARNVQSGLGGIYAAWEAANTVGGATALLARVDAGTADEADRVALAAVPGGEKRLREIENSLSWFYGGRP